MDEIRGLYLAKPIAQTGMRQIRGVERPHHDGQERGVTTNALAREE